MSKSRRLNVHTGVLALILLAAMITGVSGCAPQASPTLGAEDNGRQVTLQQGQTLTIKLEANPTTGYSWEFVEPEKAILEQVGESEYEPESDLLGAPSTQTLRFEAVQPGQTELKLVYRRPWETDVEPLETFTVLVTVQ
jgi:inhibitor of cysteine peptidase